MDGVQRRIAERQTAFGAVRIWIERDDHALAEMTPIPMRIERHVPGSMTVIVQHMGFVPARMTVPIHVASQEDFRALVAMIGTTQTLTIDSRATAQDAPREIVHGALYAKVPDVELVAIDEAASFITGRVRCLATFARATPADITS